MTLTSPLPNSPEEYFSTWHATDIEGSEGLIRVIQTTNLTESTSVVERALAVIVAGGYTESSTFIWDDIRVHISIRVCIPGPVTDEYRTLADKIEEAIHG